MRGGEGGEAGGVGGGRWSKLRQRRGVEIWGGGGYCRSFGGGFVGQLETWLENDYGYCANTSVTLYEPMSRTGKKPRPTLRLIFLPGEPFYFSKF